MGQLINIDVSLIKEAYDVVNQLKVDLAELTSKYETEHKELLQLKEAADREKLADILEEKGLVPFDKIVGLREGKLANEEVDNLRTMAQVDFEHATSVHKPKTASEEFHKASEEARVSQREKRGEKLLEDLKDLQNYY